jgi:hypothetical protein
MFDHFGMVLSVGRATLPAKFLLLLQLFPSHFKYSGNVLFAVPVVVRTVTLASAYDTHFNLIIGGRDGAHVRIQGGSHGRCAGATGSRDRP